MKFEIDTDKKTIRLKENVKLSDLIQELKDLLDRDWENYALIMDEKVEYVYPPNHTSPKTPNQDPDNPYTIIC